MAHRFVKLLLVVAIVGVVGGLLQTPLFGTTRIKLWSTGISLASRWGWIDEVEYTATHTDQLAELRAENIRLRSELQDYDIIRQQLRQPTLQGSRVIQAIVVGEPLDVFRTHLLLNQGTESGLVIGAPVIVGGSTLVGFISELSDHTAVCRLLWHPATSLPAEVVEAEFARGLLTGHLHTSLMLSTIPRDATVAVGQSVVTAAQDLTPAGLVIGQVERVYQEENEAYQHARLKLPYDPAEVRAVSVIVPP
jgi:cell shape-determining protein MreC